ncbi:hypothetical protein [Mucilaginibacter polytrichastri]|uniref:Lipocalin-like domain-containing protein n=1 Tax=Mucilaginibacter polytrichastri TaxID=1302689 RepID=A0A1Q6A606_9SPHI|nr:hypothetical protein [Mucilaginibacter polytrichastri]OKS89426.1 hypothetical protein RG47T_4910 [Mucilaginibacter polytrichastri]SFS72783.1 hypothetical protein SAMN04487890_103184 [Mucilaginibacter polytrichastri]
MKPIMFLIATVLAFVIIQSCKKDSTKNNVAKTNNEAIVGTWENPQIYPSATGRSQVYIFNQDGTFESKFAVIDPVNNQIVGYTYKSTGKYALTSNQLVFSNVTGYSIKDNGTTPVPESQLVNVGQLGANTFSIGFTTKKDSLSMLINCPPNADCTGITWFQKK